MNDSKRFNSLTHWTFWIVVLVSGVAGIRITRMLSYHILMAAPFLSYCWPLSLIVLRMIFAGIIFFIIYLVLTLSLGAAVEIKYGAETHRSSFVRGIIYSALIPFILGILGLVLMLLAAHSGMHDSM